MAQGGNMADLEFTDEEGSKIDAEQPESAVVTINDNDYVIRRDVDESADEFAKRLKHLEDKGGVIRPASKTEQDSVKEHTEKALPDAIKVKRGGQTYTLHRAGIDEDTWKNMVDRAPEGSELVYEAKPPPPAPEEQKAPPPEEKGRGALPLSADTGEEEEPVQASTQGEGGGGGFFGAIRDAAGKMALGAQKPPPAGDPTADPSTANTTETPGRMMGTSAAAPPAAEAPLASRVGGAIGPVARDVALSLYPPTSWIPSQQTLENEANANVAGMPAVPRKAPSVDTFPPPPPGGSMSAGVGFSTYQPQMPGIPPPPKLVSPEAAGREEMAAQQALADTAMKEAEARSKVQAGAMDRDIQMAARQAALAQEQQAEMQKHITRVQELQVEMRKVQNVDPNRLWNSMSTGQHIGAAFGILLGGVGAGSLAAVGANSANHSLKIIDDAINRDIDAQKFNIGQRRQALRDEFSNELTISNMSRQKFGDAIHAASVERQMMWENVGHQLDQIATLFSSPKAQDQARLAKAIIQGKIDAEVSRQALQVDANALQRVGLRNQMEHLKLEASKVNAQMAVKTGGRGRPLEEKTRVRLSGMNAQMGAMEKLNAVYNEAFKTIPGTDVKVPFQGSIVDQRAALHDFNVKRDLLLGQMASIVEGNTMREGEVKRIREWFPDMDNFRKVKGQKALDELRNTIRRWYNEDLLTAHAQGYDISGFAPMTDEEIVTTTPGGKE